MSEMPEKIWVTSFRYAVKGDETKLIGRWDEREEPNGMLPYIRADIADKRVEELEATIQKAFTALEVGVPTFAKTILEAALNGESDE